MTMEEQIGRIDEQVQHLVHELLGNGQPGKIALLTARVASIERWRAFIAGSLFVIAGLLTAVVTISGGLLVAKLSGK